MLDRLKTILSNSHSEDWRADPSVDIEGESVPVRIRRNPRARRISMRADAVKREIRITIPNYTPTATAMVETPRRGSYRPGISTRAGCSG